MATKVDNAVVISGGTGFIASYLIKSLADNGYKPVVLGREPKSSVNIPNMYEYAEWDGKNEGPWTEYIPEAEAVINLAGASIGEQKWTEERKKIIRSSRMSTTSILSKVINSSSNPPKVFISGSAIGYYGNRGDEELTEDSRPGNDFLAKLCVDWEAEANKAAANTRVVNIRTGVVQDAKGGSLMEMLPLFKAYMGGPLGSGKQWFSWVHIADEVGIILWAVKNNQANGPYNLASPNPVTMKEFAKSLGNAINRPSWLKVPEIAIRAKLGEAAGSLLASQRVYPKRALEMGYDFKYPNVKLALNEIAKRL
jgi:uncharacterized protein (TIGR01777 family)